MFSPIRRSILYFADWRLDMLRHFQVRCGPATPYGAAISTAARASPVMASATARQARRREAGCMTMRAAKVNSGQPMSAATDAVRPRLEPTPRMEMQMPRITPFLWFDDQAEE